MGKLFVPDETRTPADHIRAALDQAERMMVNLDGAGSRAIELLHLLDKADEGLTRLEEDNVDVRVERTRLKTIKSQLRHRKNRFLREVTTVLQGEREKMQPDHARWWWFLDEAAAKQRRRNLRRGLIGVLTVTALLFAAWVAYDRLIAPPRPVRQAFRHSAVGKTLVEEGDLQAALAEFEKATTLYPDDPNLWTWKGVLHDQLGEADKAEVAFERARFLHENLVGFLLSRSQVRMRVGDTASASDDVQRILEENPESGHGYYLRANIAVANGSYAAALADLERAATLAHAAHESDLEAQARVQRAMLLNSQPLQPSPSSP